MKNIFVFVAAIILLAGCKLESTQIKELQSVYPDCEIRKIPEQNATTHWLVKTPSNKIIYVYFDEFGKIVSHSMY